ncbi:M1 family aminopeptidase [Polaribacter sp. MED152]|uniref:M1 family metallopeptidase n=1 Tax=Polaribacter sp. MED152 TaxID=313598 RepID=UPI000068CCB9|nr:M1 family aminopeptidase [Polaribacter sp. MED152]EAQ42269.1 peptidase family M1 [Polaribacter sp. MED152]
MKFLTLFLAFTIITSCTSPSKKLKLEKGISYDLAVYRKKQISDIVYNIHFKIPAEKTQSIASKLTVNFNVNDLEYNAYLDFNEATSKLKSVKINNENVAINHQKEHLILDKTKLVIGANQFEILFDAGEKSLNRNNDFLYTLLVPDRASTLFPVFDQPDLKAKYNLRITAPKDWKVLAGGFEESAIEVDGFIEHSFRTTDLMSSYLFSFVAGKFSEVTQNPGAFDMRFLYRENNQEKITESVSDIFKIHQNSIDFLENYTSVKFPFQKMDFATIPPFQYGGMEHVGAIQYRESSLFLDKNATQSRKLRRAKLIAHETSHMWFGDLVTMKWFNDVWMKEVFANFMADKIVNPVYPEVNHTLSFMMSHYPSAYSEDRTKGTNPIRQKLDNLKNAGSLYGRIIYNKAPIMMRQLEYLLGENQFREGIQEYIKTYSNSNADWLELVDILDQKSSGNIKNWSNVWVNSSGRPIISEEIETNEKGNVTKFIIHQKAEDGSDKIWTQSFKIQLMDARGYVKNINIKNMGASFDITEAVKDFKPGQVLYNINGFGYGVFPIYKDKIDSYKLISDEVSRGYQFINLYENMLLGTVSPKDSFHVFLDAIKTEKNELIVNYLSGRIQNIYWTFLTKKQRDEIQISTEENVMLLLQKDLPKNIKKTLFNLYQSIAISESGMDNLYEIWKGEIKINQLFLNENNLTSLAFQLAVLQHPETEEILATQETKISNPDQLERFQWLLPAVSNNVNVRNDFMTALFDKKNREKESWVQSGLGYIHHPLRQNQSVKFLPEILNKLEEVQLTGDIFFPKGWLASSIGQYSSQKAYDILTNFVNENPDYNPILLKKLYQTTDDLTRAQNIKK